jgi:hypothetical protein
MLEKAIIRGTDSHHMSRRAQRCYPDMPESEIREAIASTWEDSGIEDDMAMIVAGFLRRHPRDRLEIDSILEKLGTNTHCRSLTVGHGSRAPAICVRGGMLSSCMCRVPR